MQNRTIVVYWEDDGGSGMSAYGPYMIAEARDALRQLKVRFPEPEGYRFQNLILEEVRG